nr:hypothetical protein [Tanacetum cinerariifolium]
KLLTFSPSYKRKQLDEGSSYWNCNKGKA